MSRLLTIGYGNGGWQLIERLLSQHQGAVVCDLRSTPRSARHPEFEQAALRESLPTKGLKYLFMGDELGARPGDPTVYQAGKVSYELLARTPYFRSGIARLHRGLESFDLVLFCAEKDPLDCHRAILVGRVLLGDGVEAQHIHHDGAVETQREMETRLIRTMGLDTTAMFSEQPENGDVLGRAYTLKERKIAYAPKGDAQLLGFH